MKRSNSKESIASVSTVKSEKVFTPQIIF
jgi:hypothetical protein